MSTFVDDKEEANKNDQLQAINSRPSTLLLDQTEEKKSQQDVTSIATTMNDNHGQTPDSAAKLLKLEMDSGLPTDYIKDNMAEVEKAVATQNFSPEHFRATNPNFAAWVASNPSHYHFVKEDLQKYRNIELNNFRPDDVNYGADSPSEVLNIIDYSAAAGLNYLNHSLAAGKANSSLLSEKSSLISKKINNTYTVADEKREKDIDRYLELQAEEAEREGMVQTGLRDAGYSASQIASSMTYGAIGGGVGMAAGFALAPLTGGLSIPAAIVGEELGRLGAMGLSNYEMETNFAYDDLLKYADKDGKTIDKDTALWVARGVGVFNAAIETWAEAYLIKMIPYVGNKLGKFNKFTRKSVSKLASEMLAKPTLAKALGSTAKVMIKSGKAEYFTEFGQSLANAGGLRIAQSIDGLKGDNNNFWDDLKQGHMEGSHAAIGSILTMGFLHSLPHFHERLRAVKNAEKYAKHTQAIVEGVNSDSFQKLPEKGQEAVKAALAGGAGAKTFFQKDVWDKKWTEAGVDPRAIAAEVQQDGGAAYDKAAANDGHIELDTDRVGRKLMAVPEHVDFAVNDSSVSPDRLSNRQAFKEFNDMMDEAEGARTAEHGPQRDHTKDEVYVKMRDQLIAARIPGGTEAAEANARTFNTHANRYAAMMNMKPVDVFNRYGSGVSRAIIDSAIKRNIDNSGPYLDMLREGKLPSLEEPDGAAKREHVQKLSDFLESAGIDLQTTDNEAVKKLLHENVKQARDAEVEAIRFQQFMDEMHKMGFYSELIQTVDQKMGTTATKAQVDGMVKHIKAEERKYMGLDEFLKGKETINKQELLDFLRGNSLRIQELTKGVESEEYKKAVLPLEEKLKELEVQKNDAVKRWKDAQGEVIRALARSGNEDYFETVKERAYAIIGMYDIGLLPEDSIAKYVGELIEKAPDLSPESARDYFVAAAERNKAEIAMRETHRELTKVKQPFKTGYDQPQLNFGGGTDYREVLFVLPRVRNLSVEKAEVEGEFNVFDHDTGKVLYTTTDNQDAHQRLQEELQSGHKNDYHSSHFNERNIFAHLRLNTYIDTDGKRVLFVQEVQSDLHKDAYKKGGYKKDLPPAQNFKDFLQERYPDKVGDHFDMWQNDANPIYKEWRDLQDDIASNGGRVMAAPFKKTWVEFAMKRVIRMAAEQGYDRVAWTTGDQQNLRNHQGERANLIQVFKQSQGTGYAEVHAFNGSNSIYKENIASHGDLVQLVGKELANKVKEQPADQWVHHKGDFFVGGHGLRDVYDHKAYDFGEKLARKFGARFGKITIPTGEDRKTMRPYEGPTFTIEQIREKVAVMTSEGPNFVTIRALNHIANVMMEEQGMSFKQAMEEYYYNASNKDFAFLVSRVLGGSYGEPYTISTPLSETVHALDINDKLKEAVLNRGFSLFQKSKLGFYSKLEAEVEKMDFKVTPSKDLANRIKNIGGIKQTEFINTGILDWLNLQERKVTKEEVLEFLKSKGLRIEQVVLGEYDREDHDPDAPNLEGVDWDDGERDHSGDDDDIQAEVESNMDDRHWVRERMDELRPEHIDDFTEEHIAAEHVRRKNTDIFTPSGLVQLLERAKDFASRNEENEIDDIIEHFKDRDEDIAKSEVLDYIEENFEQRIDEDGLKDKLMEVIEEEAYERARDYVESDDYHGARYTVTERSTGWSLHGSDEMGWYSSDVGEEMGYNLEEAQVRLVAHMIEAGEIEGSLSSLIKEADIKWREPKANMPAHHEISRMAEELFQANPDKYIDKELTTDASYYEGLTPEEARKKAEYHALEWAREEIREKYRDQSNPENKVKVDIGHDILKGYLLGNETNGYTLHIPARNRRQIDIHRYMGGSSNLEEAKAEAIAYMIVKGLVSPTNKVEEEKSEDFYPDVNRVTGKAKWKSYKVDGGEKYREFLLTLPDVPGTYINEVHFPNNKNVLTFVRVTVRIDENGEKHLTIEELQGDWNQEGREQGYKNDEDEAKKQARIEELDKIIDDLRTKLADTFLEDKSKEEYVLRDELKAAKEEKKELEGLDPVTDVPIKNTEEWVALALRRMIDVAVAEGFNSFSIFPGIVHSKRWGSDAVSWKKQVAQQFNLLHDEKEKEFNAVSPDGSVFKSFQYGAFVEESEAKALAESWIKERAEMETHWLVYATEQSGGFANGINIEEAARRRGLLTERDGAKIETKAQLRSLILNHIKNERGPRSITNLTESIWKQMQEKDEGIKLPRKEGIEYFYDNMIPKKVLPAILKTLDKDVKVEKTKLKTTRDDYKREYVGPDLSADELMERVKDSTPRVQEVAKWVADDVRAGNFTFAQAMVHYTGGDLVADVVGGKIQQGVQHYQDAYTIKLTPKLKEEVAKGQPYLQKNNDEANAQIHVGGRLGIDRRMDIEFLRTANFSSFVHEQAHYWLEVMADAVKRGEANDELKSMWADTLKWLGVKDYSEITREHHELFARGYEAYHFEGKAPTPALQRIFNTFKVWMQYVYKSLTELHVELSPEIRSVFDRMFASEEEIKQAKQQQGLAALISDPANANMTEEQAAKYSRLVKEAHDESVNRLTVETMQQLQKERSALWKRERAQVKKKMTAQVDNQADQVLLKMLRTGKGPGHAEGNLKLNKEALIAEYGAEAVKKLPSGIYSESGYNHHELATLLGIDTNEMLEMLGNVKNRNELIEQKTSEEMTNRHGDQDIYINGGLQQKAMELIHSDKQAELMQMEMEWLLQNKTKEAAGMVKSVVRRVTPLKVIRENAEQMVMGMAVSEIKPHLYLLAEKRHSNAAYDLMMKGDFEGAFDAKKKALLNLELFRAATNAKKFIEKSEKKFEKLFIEDKKLGKNRDMNTIGAARAILASFGFGKDKKTPEQHLEKIKEYDPAAYEVIKERVENATQQADYYKNLSLEKFIALNDLVGALWNQARSDMLIEIEGKKLELAKVNGEVLFAISRLKYDRSKLKNERTQQENEVVDSYFLTMKSRFTRMESKIDSMDTIANGDTFRKYIYNPVREATELYRDKKREITVEFNALLQSHSKALADSRPIPAKSIGFTFKNKMELLGAMLHMGTESNFRKLLLGNDWGSKREDGSLDSTNWQKFISDCEDDGTLTEADYRFLEKYWQIIGSFKGEAQKAHMQMFGYYFDEIEGRKVTSKFGTFQGGYVPATPDRTRSKDPAIRNEVATIEDNIHNELPQKNDGFSKSRVENYSTPLLMDIGMMINHTDQVLKFTYITPRVRDALKIVHNKDVRNAFDAYDPTFVEHVVIPFLKRASTQSTTIRSGNKGADKFFSFARSNRSMQLMFANIPNTIQQVANYIPAALRANPIYLLNAVYKGTTDNKATTEMIASKSVFMKNKFDRTFENAQAQSEAILKNFNKLEKGGQWFSKNTYLAQSVFQNLMDTHVWLAAYDQAIASNNSEKQAVAYADSTVRATQGTYAAEDTAAVETQSPLMKTLMMFFGFFNNMGNFYVSEWNKAGAKGGLEGAAKKGMIAGNFVLFAVAGKIIIEAVKGNVGKDKDDDEDWLAYWFKYMFGASFELAAPMAGFLGQVAFTGYKYAVGDNKGVNSGRLSVSPLIGMTEQLLKNTLSDKKLKDREKVKTTLDAISMLPMIGFVPTFGLAKGAGLVGAGARNLNRLQNLNGYSALLGGVARPAAFAVDKAESGRDTNLLEDAQGFFSGRVPKE